MKHLTLEQLQEYSDGILSQQRLNETGLHLNSCSGCKEKLKALHKFETSIRNISLERVNPDFTQRVIKQLNIQESSSVVWSIFKNLAPILGLVFIVGTVYAALKYTGMLEGSGVGESVTATKSAYNSVTTQFSNGITTFNGWLKNLFPFLYTRSSYGLSAFLIVLFIVVAILDRFIFIPIFRKRI